MAALLRIERDREHDVANRLGMKGCVIAKPVTAGRPSQACDRIEARGGADVVDDSADIAHHFVRTPDRHAAVGRAGRGAESACVHDEHRVASARDVGGERTVFDVQVERGEPRHAHPVHQQNRDTAAALATIETAHEDLDARIAAHEAVRARERSRAFFADRSRRDGHQ